MKSENKFEKLCTIASKNNWCWKIYCTTCGCQDIRGAFYYIGLGKSLPNNISRISQLKIDYNRREPFPNEVLNEFLKSVSSANLFEINKNCKFPDWLGYIGLILHLFGSWDGYFKIARETGRIPLVDVVKSYCPQFIKMVNKNSNAYKILNDIIDSNYLTKLKVSDLEEIELGIIHND